MIVLLLLSIFCACPSSFAKEKIVFWYGATQEEKAAYEEMISDFERENPDIDVDAMLVPMNYIERKLVLSVAGGVPPDVVRFYTHLGGELMSRGGLEPLDDLIARDDFDIDDFYPVGLEQNSFEGKLYGVPWVMSPYALFYNKKLFAEAGLDPERPPKTWQELRDYALKLTKRDADGNLERIGFADFLYNPNNFALYLWQSGGTLVDENNNPTFNSEEGLLALKWMKSFLTEEAGSVDDLLKFSANFRGAAQDPFGQGKLAMRVDSPFRIPDLARYFPDLDYAVTQIPYNTTPACEVVGNSLVIPRGSNHREAAWRFIKFATSDKQIRRICAAGGRIPARVSSSKAPEFYSDPIRRAFVDQIPYGRSIPVVPGWQQASRELATHIQLALEEKKTPEKALSDANFQVKHIFSIADEDMSKYPQMPWRTTGIAAAVVLLLGITFTFVFVRRHTAHSTQERSEARQFFAFSSPWVFGFIVLTFGAMAASLLISFTRWDTLSPAHFVGLRNYVELFTSDPKFFQSAKVTAYYAVFSIPLAIVFGLAISVLMNQKVFGVRFFRTVFYLPAIITGVATAVLWDYIFNPTNGLLNEFLKLHIIPWIVDGSFAFIPLWSEPPAWLLDPQWAMPAFIIMGVWGVGGAMIIYLAALQGIPEELYEAARLDGAGAWNQFRNVTIPLLTPAIFYQLIVGTMFALQLFTQAYIMTDGGPHDATLFYGLYLFRNAFEFMKLGYASSIAWILFAVVVTLTVINFKLAKRWVYYEGVKSE